MFLKPAVLKIISYQYCYFSRNLAANELSSDTQDDCAALNKAHLHFGRECRLKTVRRNILLYLGKD